MAGAPQGPPEGYRERAIGGTLVVAQDPHFDAICGALGFGTLHAWASAQPGAVAMKGRGVAWATRLPTGQEVVVRHSRHGGMLAALTRDLFLAPTRAPAELRISHRLRAVGVQTPEIVAIAVYSAFGPLCRADVITARVDGLDLPTALREHAGHQDRHDIRVAVSRLLEGLWSAGARHPDLNARNVLVMRPFSRHLACVLDVDRVTFGRPRDTDPRNMVGNGMRLTRSLIKLRENEGLEITPNELMSISQFSPPSARAIIEARE